MKLKDGSTALVIHVITADEINNADVAIVKQACEEALLTYRRTLKLTLLTFSISSYDNDPRALFSIPEVRTWFQVLVREVPYVLSLLAGDGSMDWVLTCTAEIDIVVGAGEEAVFRFRPGTIKSFVTERLAAAHEMFGRIAPNETEFTRLCDEATQRMVEGFGRYLARMQ